MAFMAPAPDQATYNVSGGMSYNISTIGMSPTDSRRSLSSLVEAPARSATTKGSKYWSQDMVAMVAGGAQAQAQGSNNINNSELLGGGMVSGGDWPTLLETKCAQQSVYDQYAPAVSRAPAPVRGGIMENARIREMLAGRVGKGWSGMEGAGITVDPSKGGLALQGVGFATSHCLAQFTSDPAFAERAAKFSSFGSGKYPQIAVPLPVNEGGCKAKSRSAESSGRLSRTSSSQNSSGVAKKLAPAVAAEMEEKQGASAAAAHAAAATHAAAAAGAAAAERSSTNVDSDVDGANTSDDKSPPGSALAQPVLEAIEGASLAAMDPSTHEVEVPAAREPTNSCSGDQQLQEHHQRGGGPPGSSPATSHARSLSGSDDSDRRKRKNSPPHVDTKAADVVDSKPKRWKGEKTEDDAAKAKAERSCSDNSGEDSGSPCARKESTGSHKNSHKDLSKQDYIHVRARRGQATDSHSLAERVRREKISERMKYLQDLVPGCSKVTGKAVMLDEIINYVQSLQRQVENLSMKLASVNPSPAAARLDYTFESSLNKELLQSRLSGGSSLGGPESTATFTMLQHQQQQQQHQHQQHHQHQQQQSNSMLHQPNLCGLDFRSMGASPSSVECFLRRSNSTPINVASGLTTVDTFSGDVSQFTGWDGELQSIVNPMGFGGHQGRFGSSILDGFHSQLPVGHMKVEM